MIDTALRLAELIERDYHDETLAPRKAAAELRRLHAENEALKAKVEVAQAGYHQAVVKAQWQATTNAELNRLIRQRTDLDLLNAELVEALQWIADRRTGGLIEGKARAALAKMEASK